MNISLGMRTLVLLAFVAAMTTLIVGHDVETAAGAPLPALHLAGA
jgi:hypothetical protein